jgi:glutamyl-tRNA reductase
MLNSLTIIHRKKPDVFTELPVGWRVFATCLRSLAFGFYESEIPFLKSTDKVYRGKYAYRFMLEVACGLGSPIVGETEVFGQFHHFAEQWLEKTALFQNVFADVKSIRQAHLSHLGSQSYGSWVRRRIKPGTPVHIVGTGQLALEILPWLRKQNSTVILYSRTPELARQRVAADVEVRDLSESAKIEGAVVVAAPVTSALMMKWIGDQPLELLIDLRDDSSLDSVKTQAKHFRLSDIFSEIEKGRIHALDKVEKAQAMIEEIVIKRFHSQTIRPFGWDDLCA